MKLAVLKGSESKSNVTISSVPYAIGRCRTANFIIAHVNVSRNHCEIAKENKSWKISDFSSSGTYVNDTLVGKGNSINLSDGDCIRFGPVENNLCWTFYSCDSSRESSSVSNDKPQTQVVLNLYSEKIAPDKSVALASALKENPVNCKNDSVRNPSEVDLKMCKQTSTNNLNVVKESENVREDSKEEVSKGQSESEKIQELTKELQEVQSALNDLEEKNSALQVELAAGATHKTESSTNLLENLTDLMETEFQCTICSELFVTAITLGCTHTFCKYCIGLWKKKQKTCPICRKKITNETRSLVVDNYIDKVVGNLSAELKQRRETIIKERTEIEPSKKKAKYSKK